MQNPLVVFQHRYYAPLAFGSNILVWLFVGWLVGDYLGAFVLTWWTRLLVSHHLTWCINSLAHYWGKQTYSHEQSAVDNFVVAFLTVGEGYHNYHHTFAWDYRNGVRWYHFDPVKWTVWSLSRVGLARGLKRVSKMRIQLRLLQEDRKLLAERLRDRVNEGRAELARRAEALSQRIQERLGEQTALAERVRNLRKTRGVDRRTVRARLRELRRELKAIRHGLRRDWKAWHELCNTVLSEA
jgi:stearoyl-CoA desaturase (delta-9 desaturase)